MKTFKRFLEEGLLSRKKKFDPFSHEHIGRREKIDNKWIEILKKHLRCPQLGYSDSLQKMMSNEVECRDTNHVYIFFQLDGKFYATASYHEDDVFGKRKRRSLLSTKHEFNSEKDLLDFIKKSKNS